MPPLLPRTPPRAEAVRDLLWRFGYLPTALPLIADANLFLTVAGDVAITTLLDFEHNGHMLALRPEFTALSARHYATVYPHDAPVVRWQFHGPVFSLGASASPLRAQREHIGAEVLGAPASLADGEVLALAALSHAQAYDSAHQPFDVGHAGVLHALLGTLAIDARTTQLLLAQLVHAPLAASAPVKHPYGKHIAETALNRPAPPAEALYDAIAPAVQRGQAMGGRTQAEITRRLVHKQQRAASQRNVAAAVDLLNALHALHGPPADVLPALRQMTDDPAAHTQMDAWARALAQAETLGLPTGNVRLRPSLVRSWEYYSGILFEVRAPDGSLRVGGGRYDGLLALVDPLGQRSVPAVGFTLALPDEPPAEATVWSLVSPSDVTDDASVRWAAWLRQHGLAVAVVRAVEAATTSVLWLDGHGSLSVMGDGYAWDDKERLLERLTTYDSAS